MAQLLSRVQVLRALPPQAFWPPPKVESALVRLTRNDRLGGEARGVGDFVHAVFSYRRKTLRKALTQAGVDAKVVLTATGLDPQSRPETFSPESFLAMYHPTTNHRPA